MRILILSCNTGGGHNTAGRAILEELQRRGIDSEMKDTMLFASQRVSDIVSGLYISSVRSPWLFQSMYRAGDAISSSKRKSPIYFANKPYASKLHEYILENEIAAVVYPHLFPAEALTYLREHKGLSVPCYGVMTDYTCHPFWEETDFDKLFIAHQELISEFVEKGIPRERLVPSGIPVSTRFVSKLPRAQARAELGFAEAEKSILIMTGSMGFGSAPELIEHIARLDDSATCTVLVGSNTALLNQLNERYSGCARVRAVPFTDKVPIYMDACDVLLSKPGGLSSTEAIVKNVPLVHTAPIPGCETANAQFFSERGMSISTQSDQETAQAAVHLLNDGQLRESMLSAQRIHCNPRAAADICDFIISDIGK